eukprot:5238050-Amphidinium_carterae.1
MDPVQSITKQMSSPPLAGFGGGIKGGIFRGSRGASCLGCFEWPACDPATVCDPAGTGREEPAMVCPAVEPVGVRGARADPV